ncbi:MAG: TonB-dependent receptor [Bacteroidales bacterium]|nr:TonB-dependent receptor [Bacteroidales bacterium]
MRFLFITIWLCMPLIIFPQNKLTDAMLFGDVKDAETGEHLPFVNIVIEGTNYGTSTDATGHYMFNNIPVGELHLVFSTIGYKTVKKTIDAKANSSQQLFVEMQADVIMTEQVVVSAYRNAVSRKEAPVIVSAITPKQMESIASQTVADGLNFTPGLRVENNCQNCGFTQLRMNGLEGAYSQILINSRPIFSTLAGVYGLEQIPVELVERIEVIRGGGSAIFGGNAIGGTVNIITKDPINNMFQISATTSLVGLGVKGSGKTASSRSLNFHGAVVSDNRKAGFFMFGSNLNRDPWDANNDSFSEMGQIKNANYGLQTYYKPGDYSRINLEYHYMEEHRRGGDKFDYLPQETNITEMVHYTNHSGGISYETFTDKTSFDKLSAYVSAQLVARDSYYGANQDPNAYGKTDGLTWVAGAQYVAHFKPSFWTPGDMTIGVENVNDRLKDTKLGVAGSDNQMVANQVINTSGMYAQYNIKYNRLKVLLGFRGDHYEIIDLKRETAKLNGTVINPRGNLLFDINEFLQLRTSYSTGYRAPQIFDEDLHIESSGARQIKHINDANLTEERSQSFSASLRHQKSYGKWETEILVEGFYTILNNAFVSDYTSDTNGVLWSTRTNAKSGAEVYGSNIEIRLAPSRKFYVQLGGTIQASLYKEAQQWGEDTSHVSREMTRTPMSYAYTIFNYEPTKKISLSVSGNYTGKMYVPHLAGGNRADGSLIETEKLEVSPVFYVLNWKGTYTFKLGNTMFLDASLGINNILNSYQKDFDYGVNRDAGYNYGPIQSRTIFFSLKLKV